MLQLNPVYLLIAVPALVAWLAQAAVRRAYDKYGAIPNRQSLSGLAVAKYLLASEGLSNVTIKSEPGVLTDHYDPAGKTLSLSEGSANSSSVAALGVVAHEVGHALQDAQGYRVMRLRTTMAGHLGMGGRWSPFVFMAGMVLGNSLVMALGAAMLGCFALFALVTLPVERNASIRALAILEAHGLVSLEEKSGVWQVLRAAAFTYAASFGRQTATLLFYALIVVTAQGAWQA